MSDPELKTAIPILRIFSVENAKEFYIDFLGFSIDWSTASATIFRSMHTSPGPGCARCPSNR